MRVLSNRADLISGGDALIDIEVANPDGARVLLNGQDVTGQFTLMEAGQLRGLVTGLALGDNTLEVLLDNRSSRLVKTITNHPKGGPVFSGPQVQPGPAPTPLRWTSNATSLRNTASNMFLRSALPDCSPSLIRKTPACRMLFALRPGKPARR